MSLRAYVRVGYISPSDHLPKHTHFSVPIEDTVPCGAIWELAREGVDHWSQVLGYTPYEWSIIAIYSGNMDLLRGKLPAR